MSDADAGFVRAELEAVLVDPLFAHSKRCQAFLRYVVDQTLNGHETELKERTVGVEALGRPVSYDTGQDPVVRTTASEVRKRLAQYYQQHPDATRRIVLPLGSYVPQIESTTVEQPAAPVQVAAPSQPGHGGRLGRRHAIAALAVVALLSAAAVTLIVKASSAPSALDLFWQPVFGANGTAKVFIGPATQPSGMPPNVITMDAASTLSRVTALMQQREKAFDVRQSRHGAFADLRHHPVVTIGLFNNQWTRRATESLRFTPRDWHIADTSHADAPTWARRFAVPGESDSVIEDFALVSRVLDAESGHWVIALGGIGTHGTAAAGEFVTSPDHVQRLLANAPAGWADMNLQVVLSTNVHDGVAGPPRIVASHFWR